MLFLSSVAWTLCVRSVVSTSSPQERSLPTTLFQDILAASGLLGSHFGIPGFPASYDYIVVGGGTAGITLATRLAQGSSATVALIEAGGFYEEDNANLTQIPADVVYWLEAEPVVRNPLIDWYQFTTPQPGFGGRAIHYASGKTLGGGSARNFLWYMRSAVGAYQKWANQVGDATYTFNNLDQYFKKSPFFFPPLNSVRPSNASATYDSAAFSPQGGPLQVAYPSWVNGISSWFGAALSKLGLAQVPGFTSGNLLGYSYIAQTSTPDQVRSSSESSFLRTAFETTSNLYVYKSTTAQKVIFNATKHANGVQLNSGGFSYMIAANKEVIVSAGTFRSPQLLMVSGVGPSATLAEYNISVLADRPGVGQNMWDHVLVGQAYAVNLTTHSQISASPAFAAQSVAEYNQNRTGILTNPGADFLAFEKLPAGSLSEATRAALDAEFGPDWPDVEYVPFDNDLVSLPTDGRNYASSLAALVAPFSRGNVTIASNDTLVNPVVNPNFLLDVRDQEVAVAAFKRARQIFATAPLKSIVNGGVEFSPGANITSDADIFQVIMETASTISHAAGTCAMGMVNDTSAVIDSHARVIGVQGLRVVDASSFPFLPPGHPQGTVYALAEKIAADILSGQ
ncbi:hypothetical protein MMC27_004953 [Xylographa pallens]|nr:hypothetical protein [Xylographa pallens]